MRFINRILVFIISGTRPFLGPAYCKYPVGCTQYTIDQLSQKPLVPALWASIKRIISCF